jgi:small subunit ribosomal protein S16
MVIIRLSRTGAKKSPFYHVMVKDSRSSRDGRAIERVGYFNPMARGGEIRMNLVTERIQYWLTQGAQVSDRVSTLWKEWLKAPVAMAAKDLPAKPVKKKKVVVAAAAEGEAAA